MKNVLALFVAMIFTTSVFAADASVVPPFLKDAVITVRLKNGKEYKFSANTHAVVLRASSGVNNQPKVVEKLVEVQKDCPAGTQTAHRPKNRVRAMAGAGPTGLKTDRGDSTVKVTPKTGALGGVGYDRMLNDDVSVGAQIMSNGTATLGLGLDF